MVEKPREDSSIVVLSVVLGVVVVIGAIGILAVAGLFVYRSQAATAEKLRVQAMVELEKTQATLRSQHSQQEAVEDQTDTDVQRANTPTEELVESPTQDLPLEDPSDVKPGAHLQAQRPHWDDVEVIDILGDSKVRVRWLSGEPGEAVIALEDLVRSEVPLAN